MDIIKFYRELEQKEPFPAPPKPFTMTSFLESVKQQLDPEEQEQMDSMLNMVQMMSMLQTMQASSDDSENPGKEDGRGGMSDLLKGMLTPEQQTMFDSINTMFPGGENSDSQNKEE